MQNNYALFRNANIDAYKRINKWLNTKKEFKAEEVIADVDGSECTIYLHNGIRFSIVNDNELGIILATSKEELSSKLLNRLRTIAESDTPTKSIQTANAKNIYATLGLRVGGATKFEKIGINTSLKRKRNYDRGSYSKASSRVARNPKTGERIKVKDNPSDYPQFYKAKR